MEPAIEDGATLAARNPAAESNPPATNVTDAENRSDKRLATAPIRPNSR